MSTPYSIVDLFCGAGGLSLGAHQAGFATRLAIDCDSTLTSSFNSNFPNTKLLLTDISLVNGTAIRRAAGMPLDGVIGGPPCQAFSEIGKQQVNDPRRDLVYHFFRIVRAVRPKFFLFENVRGLLFDRNIDVLNAGLSLLPQRYRVTKPIVLDCADFGAATSRPRIFVLGYDPDQMPPIVTGDIAGRSSPATVRDAISDLRKARFIGLDAEGFDCWRHLDDLEVSAYAARLRGKATKFTGHRKTIHSVETATRFRKIQNGRRDPIGKHSRLSWLGQCPTLRAGTGPDRGSYQSVRPIHPSEHRVITVREAARLQGFPDAFVFHPTTWHSFRMIGNSVCPLLASGVLTAIRRCLDARISHPQAAE